MMDGHDQGIDGDFTAAFLAVRRLADLADRDPAALAQPIVAALVMGAAAYFSYGLIHSKIDSNTVATAGAILIGVVLYLAGALWMRMFSQEDLAFIPGGSILAKLQSRRK